MSDPYIDSALEWVDRYRGDGLRDMVGIQDAGYIEEMADEIRRLRAERDTLDKAWARLLKAEMEGKLDTADAAKQALRALNVDVDALLGDR